METLKDIAIGFGVAVLLSLAIYFFYIVPENKKTETKIDEAYKKGLADCFKKVDTVYIKGKDSVSYRDTSFTATEPATIGQTDSSLTIISSFDTSYVSGKDSIYFQATAIIDVKKDGDKWDTHNTLSRWFSRIEHKDYERIDTVKITVPVFYETVVKETDWLWTGLAYIGGTVITLILFLIGK
jgi:hypothetical protein